MSKLLPIFVSLKGRNISNDVGRVDSKGIILFFLDKIKKGKLIPFKYCRTLLILSDCFCYVDTIIFFVSFKDC